MTRHPITGSRSATNASPRATLMAAAVVAALTAPVAAQLQFTELPRKGLPGGTNDSSALASGDVDGDGDSDIVIGVNGQNRLYLNNGGGTFSDVTASRMPMESQRTNAGILLDVDGDGDLDNVTGNRFSLLGPHNRLYLNLQRQLHAPAAPQIGQPYTLEAYMRYGTSTTANFSLAYVSTAPDSVASMFGTIGLDLAAAAPFPTTIVLQPVGVGSVGFTVPNVASLVGQPIHCQSMLVAYPFDLRLSNVVADVIQ